jgi:glycosyltransferase involved in cell wall biosynthesis
MAEQVVLGWPISSLHGWGVYGLNLALQWAGDPDIALATACESVGIDIDPLQARALAPFIVRSVALQNGLQQYANGQASVGGTLLGGLNDSFQMPPCMHNVRVTGDPTIGVIFFENALSPEAVERANLFPCTVTGSHWNEALLRAYGVKSVRTVHQGFDPAQFHPGPKPNLLPDRFLIFSGGKAEYRKAQDLVLAAFKIFSERHPEAMLVTAWYNHWPDGIRSLDWSGLLPPVPLHKTTNQIDVAAWAAANGIGADRVIDLGTVPNPKMPAVLREMDVALFPNRAEGGTNLVAMEAMACGLPVILSRNTGHIDLIDGENCYPLDDQRLAARGFAGIEGVPGWGESRIEEIVARLEEIFTGRAEARRRGQRAAELMARLTWRETARKMKDIVMELRKA